MTKYVGTTVLLAGSALISSLLFGSMAGAADCPAYFNQEVKKLHSNEIVNLCEAVRGKAVLVVNTASRCGYTPQFKGLEALHQEYKDRGLVVLGFPSNDFRQEATTEQETARVCHINYGVTFTMLAPVSVTGATAHPLFQELARQSESPDWNFHKYVVDANGQVRKHFGSNIRPDARELRETIEQVL